MSSDASFETEKGEEVTMSMHGYGICDLLIMGANDCAAGLARLTRSEAARLGRSLIAWSEDRPEDVELEFL